VPDPGPNTAPLVASTPDHMMLAQEASVCCLQSPLQQKYQYHNITCPLRKQDACQDLESHQIFIRYQYAFHTTTKI
jgi:hypothetical protein